MNTDSPEPLDKLLHDWAESRDAGAAHSRRLANHILSAAHDPEQHVAKDIADDFSIDALPLPDRPVPASRHVASRPSAERGGQLMIGGAALALSLVLAACLLYYNLVTTPTAHRQSPPLIANSAESPPPTAASETGSGAPSAAFLGASVLVAKRQLLSEANALFDNRIAWIADGERDVSLDVLEEDTSKAGEFMLIRVVVAKRVTPDDPWSTVWQTDVISRSEALVEIAAKQLNGSSLALWTYPMSDGEVAVDMDLILNHEMQQQSSSSMVLRAGHPTRVDCSAVDGVEQCVFHTVMPLQMGKKLRAGNSQHGARQGFLSAS